MALDAALAEVNDRLKAGRHRVRVERRRNSLFLRATLPDRKDPSRNRQQCLALGAEAALAQLEKAESEALRLSLSLRNRSFKWADWDPEDAPSTEAGLTVHDFIAAAERLHADKYRKDPERGAAAWAKKWRPAIKKLPARGLVNETVLLGVIHSLPAGSASRRDQGNLLSQVAKSLGMETAPLLEACRGYGVDKLQERDIPTDEEIESAFDRLRLPHWQWTFGMCAAFGLRPHECAGVQWLLNDWIKVGDVTKTGARQVTACPSAWIERFNLRNLPRPPQKAQDLSKVFNDALDRDGVSIKPYSLRHAFALRLMDNGVPPELGSRLMGHSLQMHEQTYKRWIEADRITKAMDRFNL